MVARAMTDPNAALFAAAQAEQRHQKIKDPPTLSVKDGVGSLSFPALSLTNHEKGKQIPARSRWEGKTLKFVVNDAAMAFIRHHWPNYREDRPISRPLARQGPLKRLKPWQPRFEPFKHQKNALAAAYGKKAFAYFMDMGTGKSKCLIDEMAELYACGQIDRAVIVAPTGVHRQWIEEQLPTHWPTELKLHALAVGNGSKLKVPVEVPAGNMTIVAVNIEALTMMPMVNALQRFMSAGRALMAVDESQDIKTPGAERTQRCWALGESAQWRRIMTGTPLAKGPEDYFAQFKFLDIGIIGVGSFTGFKRQYCQMGGFNNNQIVGYWNTDRLHELIAPHSFRVEKADCIDLPPKLYSRRTVELGSEQRAVYMDLRTQLLTELSDGTIIEAEQAVQRILRLQQVVQGFLPREDGSFEEYDISNRIQAVDDLIAGAKGKVVIWCRFRHDINLIMERYGEQAVRYDGATSPRDREISKARFMDADSPVQIFVSNAQAGGAGLNLAGLADTVIYFSNSFSSLDRWQSEDRTHRIGTRGTVNYYDIVCRGTVDTAILANLRRKKDITDMSLTELRSLIEGSDES
jgi:SNF2 family DNA or RNA helicase